MKLDRALAKEINALNGDGSRDARFKGWNRIQDARHDLSSPAVRQNFNECLKKHGRAAIAVCVASTLYARRDRLENWGLSWAVAVLDIWTNRGPSFVERAAINDSLHPTRICEYAGNFIKLTTE